MQAVARRGNRRWWRTVLIGAPLAILIFALLFPLLYALTIPEERGPLPTLPPVPAGSYEVTVVDWGYHTAIVVEQPPGWALGPPGEERAPYLEYAWGDRRFYMESDHRPLAVFAAVVLPTESVLFLDGRERPNGRDGARAEFSRQVHASELHELLVGLEGSFRQGPDGRRLPAFPATSAFSGRFFPAYGRYLWTRDCNWWTVSRLHAAQLANDARGVLFSGQVQSRLPTFRPVTIPTSSR